MTAPPPPQPVLLYDGECGLCARVVRRLLRSDRAGRLRFAPLQGPAARDYLRGRGLPTRDFDSLVFVPDWHRPADFAPQLRTDGALAAAAVVGGGWRAFTWMRIVPAWLRDPGYRLIARVRYVLFGRARPEMLARPEWADRFL
jgi:predicted DCC family thiol-disulfide oxidoreductase YuxK